MKKIGIVLLCFFFMNFTYCQGITNISISPPYPTENDSIIISVFQTYNSSGCPLYSKDISISNNEIVSSSLHCMGMLSALCDEVDTFHLAPLNPGIYSYVHTMTSGFGMPDCTPGVVPDDVDSISFEVISLSGDNLVHNSKEISIYPNPSSDIVNIDIDGYSGNFQIELYDFKAKLLLTSTNNKISIKDYPKGLYFMKITYGNMEKKIKLTKN